MRAIQTAKHLLSAAAVGGLFFATTTTALADAPRLGPNDPDPTDRPLFAADRILIQLSPNAAQNAVVQNTAAGVRTSIPSLDGLLTSSNATALGLTHIKARNESLAASLGLDRWYSVTVPEGTDIPAWIAQYKADPNVDEATPDYYAYSTATPNDPTYSIQWGHNNTGQMLDYCWGCGGHDSGSPVGTPGFDADAQLAWDKSQGYGSSSVVIAILDSGVDAGHPDLNQVAGYDYGDNDSNADDNSSQPGHGTACAGVAAAISNNNLGPAGIAGGCSIMPLKVADSGGSLFFSYIQNGLIHAADNGADVANMSFGAAISSDPSTDSALSYAYNAGVTLLAATGNENASTISYPAIHSQVIAVGAASPCGDRKRSSSLSSEVNPGVSTDPNGYTCDGERWWGSNYGSTSQGSAAAVDFLAPTILPTTDIQGSGGYNSGDFDNWFNGTSCATPYAAGVAALIISANPSFTPAQVRDAIRNGCEDVQNVESGTGWDRYSGYGMINANNALGGGGGGPQDYASLPYTTGFEGGLDTYWATQSDNGFGRIQTTSANGPFAGSSHLTLDSTTSGNFALNEARLHLDLSGESQVDLDFQWKEFGDETHSQDGIYFSDNAGASFVKVQDLNGASYTNNTWQSFSLDLDALAGANGLSLSSNFVIKFQQYDNYPIATDGFAFDEISVTSGAPPAPTVTVTDPNGGETLTAASNFNVTWSTTGTVANVSIEYSTNSGASWTTVTGSTTNDGTYTWSVPSTATTQGRVRVADASNSSINDVSDADFTIDVPSGGGNYASLPYATGFEGGLDSYWSTQSDNSFGRIQTTSANTPHSGSTHLTMDSNTNGNFALNEAWLGLDLAGESQVELSFWWKEFGDETHTQDGVYFSDNGGSSFVKVQDLNGASYTNNTWQSFVLDLDALASSNGLSLTSTFVVKFQQYDNYAITTDGHAIDDISVTAGSGGGGGDYASLPYSTGFEGGLDNYWSTDSDNSFGRVQTASANGPHGGSTHLTMDSNTNGNYATNEAVLALDLSGETQVDLSFWWKEFGDETHSQDGVYFSDNDGSSYVKVLDLNGASYTNNTWQSFDLDVDALASANGLSLSGTFLVKFQQYDNYAITTDGHAIDDISVTAGSGGGGGITAESEPNGDSGTSDGPVGDGIAVSGTLSSGADDDWFYLDVGSAGNINISLTMPSGQDFDWFLYNSSLTEVARGYTVNNPETGSYNASAGRYYLFVDGYNGSTGAYSLTVSGGLARFAMADGPVAPKEFKLHANAPNPFQGETVLRFDLPRTTQVDLSVYDAQGRRVRTLVDRQIDPGFHSVPWDGRDEHGRELASGVYFTVLQTPERTARMKTIRTR